jgi:hypothetical protein
VVLEGHLRPRGVEKRISGIACPKIRDSPIFFSGFSYKNFMQDLSEDFTRPANQKAGKRTGGPADSKN